jgi:hypothetical protein
MTNHSPTRPAPPEYCAGEFFIGTIGFDLYLALFATQAALNPARVPADLGKLLGLAT